MQQRHVHARLAAGRASEGVPAPGARGHHWSRRFRREIGQGNAEEEGEEDEEEDVAPEDVHQSPVRRQPLRLPRLEIDHRSEGGLLMLGLQVELELVILGQHHAPLLPGLLRRRGD
eukprot:scaffold19276_cov51-Phaeocystis_antarctica.AAC.2